MSKLVKYWYTKHPILFLLIPFSYLYLFCTKIRYWLYAIGLKKSYRFNLPIIVIGNLTVGGTGKTPLIIGLAEILKKNGYRPGIISRGYKSKIATYPQLVTKDSDPVQMGDEPVLIANKTDCPVVISPKRKDAVNLLLERFKIDLVLSDDGLQHHALKRDLEIVLIDERKFGNGFYLPAGPLRESTKRLQTVNFILYNGGGASKNNLQIRPGEIYNLLNPQLTLSNHSSDKVVHAVSGIGNPDRFFELLRELGFRIIEHSYSDHYVFKEEDINFPNEEIVIMTEKDAAKCLPFAGINHWVLPIVLEISEDFKNQFLAKVSELKVAKTI